jgi:uncharacterized Zn finger protein
MKTMRTWWGQKFIAALEGFTDAGRLARGRSYANNDRIQQWNIDGMKVSAQIRGNINPYFEVYEEPIYKTQFELKPIAAADWAKLIRELGSQAGYVSRLLLNEMPDRIEEPFKKLGLYLLPSNAKDLKAKCSCPDWGDSCKHIAGLYYFLAAKIDRDPFLLFELRGLPKADLLAQLRQTPLGAALADALDDADTPVEAAAHYYSQPKPQALPQTISADAFWRAAKRLPDVVDPAAPPAVPALLAKKGGDYPGFWTRENSFIEAMEAVHEAIRKRSNQW